MVVAFVCRLAVVAVVLTLGVASVCLFPSEMYVADADHPWRMLSRDPYVNSYHRYRRVRFVATDKFQVEYMGSMSLRTSTRPVLTHTYRCIEKFSDHTYMIVKETGDTDFKYMCLQFKIRSPSIVQWATSSETESPSAEGLCDNNSLTLRDDLLVLYYGSNYMLQRQNLTHEKCPFEGGYLVNWEDPVNDKTMCEGDIPPLKMENECEAGEGLRFQVPQEQGTCSGEDSAIMNSPYICLAHWNYAGYTFVVMVRPMDTLQHIHCMRVPMSYDDVFNGHMFLDAVCDSTDDIGLSQDYRELAFEKYPVINLCEDETPACKQAVIQNQLRPEVKEACDISVGEVCRKTCDVCQIDEIGDQSIVTDEELRGLWIQSTGMDTRDTDIIVLEKSFIIKNHGQYFIVSESECGRHLDRSATGKSREYLLLKYYTTNGCSPRLTSILIARRSRSVWSYSISKSIPAPVKLDIDVKQEHGALKFKLFVDNNHWKTVCSKLSFGTTDALFKDKLHPYPGGWFNVVNPDHNAPTVNCHLPLNSTLRHFVMRTVDGGTCTGSIDDLPDSPDRFTANVDGCELTHSSDPKVVEIRQQSFRYICLASFAGEEAHRRYVITEKDLFNKRRSQDAVDDSVWGKTYLCWLFLEDKGEVLLLPHSSCDANSERLIAAGISTPAAQLALSADASSITASRVTSPTVLFLLLLVVRVARC